MTDGLTRSWCFTINNYDTNIYQQFIKEDTTYTVCGLEVGDTGTPHIQGYMYFKNKKSFNWIKKQYPTAHIEPARLSPEIASDYCKKSDPNFFEKGKCPAQGSRNDLTTIRTLISEGKGMRDVVNIATSYQSVKMAEQILKYNEQPRKFLPEVSWYYGSTGTGKTKHAYEVLGDDLYSCMSTGKWFDGYDAHPNILIDDMRRDFLKFHELLRLLDRYAYRVETKGGTRQFLGKKIIITSAYSPHDLFETREDIGQLIRRIHIFKEFTPSGINTVYNPKYNPEI